MTDKQNHHQVSSPLPTNPHLSLCITKQIKSWTSAQSNMPISKSMHAPPITKRQNGSQNSLNTYALGNSSSSVTPKDVRKCINNGKHIAQQNHYIDIVSNVSVTTNNEFN